MALLQAAINPNLSIGGAEVTIIDDSAILPEMGLSGGTFDTFGNSSNDQIQLYTVRSGDSLSEIAEMFSVSVNTIIWGNDIKNKTIIVGQTLVILPVSGVRHVVKSGDTVQNIAKLYHGDTDEIIQFNNLAKDAKLAAGDVILVPNGEIQIATSKPQFTAKPSVANTPKYIGYYMRPIAGGIKTQGIHGNNGVDLAAPLGTPIVASAAGRVIVSKNFGWNGGYGNYVVIMHDNGTQTLYAHNNRNIVMPGQIVSKGEIIAYMGSSGNSTGFHVHFEIRNGPRNPF